jgi:hypothetical protein
MMHIVYKKNAVRLFDLVGRVYGFRTALAKLAVRDG